MKSCRKNTRPAAARQSAGRGTSVPVHRYSHPIRTKSLVSQGAGAEELLAGILETLSRQSELLEELLRRAGGEGSDTK